MPVCRSSLFHPVILLRGWACVDPSNDQLRFDTRSLNSRRFPFLLLTSMKDIFNNGDLETLEKDKGVLWSLRHYQALRDAATNVTSPEGNHLENLFDTNGQPVVLCPLRAFLPVTGSHGNNVNVLESLGAVQLAAHHLNTGDGSIVPELTALPDRCPIRFTVETIDTQNNVEVALSSIQRLAEQNRALPCAFVEAGQHSSDETMDTAQLTSELGYVQISSQSTANELDNKDVYSLFGRTIPSSLDTSPKCYKNVAWQCCTVATIILTIGERQTPTGTLSLFLS